MSVQIDERKLQEISMRVEHYAERKPSPIFEMYITLFSITTAIVLFLYEDMMTTGASSTSPGLNRALLDIMPQYVWAAVFFSSGIVKAVGLILEIDWLRVLGLLASAVIYLVIAVCLLVDFPNFGSIIFLYTTVFTIYSISMVKLTGIRNHYERGDSS